MEIRHLDAEIEYLADSLQGSQIEVKLGKGGIERGVIASDLIGDELADGNARALNVDTNPVTGFKQRYWRPQEKHNECKKADSEKEMSL